MGKSNNLKAKQRGINFPLPGERYEALVPDTLDLVDRAELAINGIGGTIDPKLHYTMFFFVNYACKIPYMKHQGSDTSCDPKYAESFPMMRIMCGSEQYIDIETAQRAELVSRIKDGLYWNFFDPARPWSNTIYDMTVGDRKNEDLSNVGATGRILRVLVAWKELDNNKGDKFIRELVNGLTRIAIRHEDYSYYPDGGFGESFNYPASGWIKSDEPKSETEGTEGAVIAYHGNQIYGLINWYSISGDTKALDLAARLTRFCMLPKFWGGIPDPGKLIEGTSIPAALPDPVCIAGKEQGHWYTHFHARALALRGMFEYGRIVRDWRVLEFVKRSYEYALTFSIPRIGWINVQPVMTNMCEGCALGDLVALGIRLSDAGMGDYWDDVDAVVRNHLVEQQLVNVDLLEKISNASPVRGAEYKKSPDIYPNQSISENVIQRSLGNFAGFSTPVSIPNPWVMQCCTGNGTPGLYYAWEGIIRENGDTAQVNLLLNRASKCLDVNSYLPYEGKVIIHNKNARRASVRIPSWVMRKEIRCDVSGKPQICNWIGNYLVFDGLKSTDKIKIEFPIKETTAKYTACSRTKDEQTYTCTFRGSTLVDISPRDNAPTSYPIYLREHMRKDKAPMKKTTRFVPEKIIHNW